MILGRYSRGGITDAETLCTREVKNLFALGTVIMHMVQGFFFFSEGGISFVELFVAWGGFSPPSSSVGSGAGMMRLLELSMLGAVVVVRWRCSSVSFLSGLGFCLAVRWMA